MSESMEQALVEMYVEIANTSNNTSLSAIHYESIIKKIYQRFKAIFNNNWFMDHPYPTYIIGIIIQFDHDIELQETCLTAYKNSPLYENERVCSLCAFLEDRIRVNKGLPQLYGTHLSFDPIKNEYMVYAIEEPHLVDLRRSKVFLPPLSDYVNMIMGDPNNIGR